MGSRIGRLLRVLAIVLLFALGWAALQLRLDLVILTPGPAFDIGTMISIKDAHAHPPSNLFLTTVYSDMDVSLSRLIQAKASGNAQVLPKKDVVPPAMSTDDYNRAVLDMMDESKTVSKIVALQKMGYDVKVTGEGARVEQLLPGNTVQGVLQVGDIVVGAAGQQVQTSNDLVNFVRRQKPGDSVSLTFKRGSDTRDVQVRTKESDTEPGIAVVGILIRTYGFGNNLPVQIDIDSENIGGPSAGLLFTLGIVDAMTPGGITSGHKVAGTGTMSQDGSVGPIGGVEQKVIGAEQSGAEYFLAPKDNYEAAKKVAHRIQVIQVANVDDAINFLKSLKPTVQTPISILRSDFILQPAA